MSNIVERNPEIQTVEFWSEALRESDSLGYLCGAVVAAEGSLAPEDFVKLDLKSLPTFGGPPPAGIEKLVLSWDEKNVLLRDAKGFFVIVTRSGEYA